MNKRILSGLIVIICLVSGLTALFLMDDLADQNDPAGITGSSETYIKTGVDPLASNASDTNAGARGSNRANNGKNSGPGESGEVFLDSDGEKFATKELAQVSDQFKEQLKQYRLKQKSSGQRNVPENLESTVIYKKALGALRRSNPKWSQDRIHEAAKEIAEREFLGPDVKIPRGESTAMLKQDIVVKVRNGRGKRDGRANVNIEIRAQKRGLPQDISFTLHHDPNLRFLEARPGQDMRRFDKVVVAKSPTSGVVNISMHGGSVLVQPGVFITVDFEVTNLADDSSQIYVSHVVPVANSYERYKVGAVGAVMTIDPAPKSSK